MADSLTITAPAQYQTFQRDGSDRGAITITGTYSGTPAAIEASFNGGAYATIDAAPAAGTFAGTLSNQAAGQGTLTVRFTDQPATLDTVADVGIGDVFIIAGQSNHSGRGTNNQSYSHATLKATLFGNDYSWKELADPFDTNTNQTDAVSSDAAAAGSLVPLLATHIMAATGYPVAFVPCANGGTTIADWAPAANHNDRATLYGSMNYRITQVGGASCVLWWQGESDVIAGTTEANYNTALDTLADAIQTDQGINLVACKLPDMSEYLGGYDETAVNAAIATAWADNANVTPGPDFSAVTPSVDGVHFITDAELAIGALQWWAAIAADWHD